MKRRILATIFLCCWPALVATAQSTTDKAAAPAKRDGVIQGKVIGDDGQPVAGAQIIAMAVGAKFGSLQIINSDEDGNFSLTGLAPGVYTFDIELAGYVVARKTKTLELYRIGESVTVNLIKGGVITGRVTEDHGGPMVGVTVFARRVRDLEGHPAIPTGEDDWKARLADDRGIYRLYGLDPGIYLVGAIAGPAYSIGPANVRRDAPTYYPSATPDTASEITVRTGEEVSGIDIRHRNERGHIISGTVVGEVESKGLSNHMKVMLLNARSGQPEGSTSVSDQRGFAFYGIRDGEYKISGLRMGEGDSGAVASPQRVTVNGSDITGIRLKLVNWGSIAGRAKIEPASSLSPESRCEPKTQFAVEEIFIIARRDEKGQSSQSPYLASPDFATHWRGDTPDQKGEFMLKNLESGQYRIEADLPNENWYIRAVYQPAAGAVKRMIDVSRTGIAVKTGEKLSRIEVIIAEGAASLRGSILASKEAQTQTSPQSQSRFRVHIIPAEASSADDSLRYAETITGNDGAFEFKHLAPGKYLLIARPVSENESVEMQSRPLAWDAVERSKLRREADRLKHEITLQPCQRVKDYVLSYGQ